MPSDGQAGPILLIVNTGSTKKRFTLKRLRELGYRLLILNGEKNWARPYAHDWIIANTNDHDAATDATQRYLEAHTHLQPAGVLTFWEDDVLLCSRIVDALGLPGIPFHVARHIRDKFLFREACERLGIPHPHYAFLDKDRTVSEQVSQLSFPVVVKPIFGTSSAFVVRVETLEELELTVRDLRASLSAEIESALSAGKDLMVEEYIDGNEVDIDILLQNGKMKFWSMSDNNGTHEPFFVETGQCIPSRLSTSQQEKLVTMAEAALEKLGVRDGVIHFEAKYSSRGPVPIEINLRMGGDEVHSFVKLAWGVDLIEHAALISQGKYFNPIIKSDTPKKFLAGKYFLPEYSGVLTSLHLPAQTPEGELVFFKETGDTVLAPPVGYEFLGWAYAWGNTMARAEENLVHLLEKAQFEVSPLSRGSSIGKTQRKNRFRSARLTKRSVVNLAKIERIRSLPLKELRGLHVGVAGNAFFDSENPIEAELASDAMEIRNVFESLGYTSTFLDMNFPFDAVQRIREQKIDIIFNLCERVNGSSLLEPHAAALFDILRVPYTGSNPFTLALAIDKIRVKKLLSFHKIPTPRWDYLYDINESFDENFPLPAIVKPANSDSSIGISNQSVVTNKEELKRQISYVLEELKRPVLIEQYIEGDEYDVSILGNTGDALRVLPLSRSVFKNLPEGIWHIYPYEAKFEGQEVYKKNIEVQRPPRGVSTKLLSLISEVALDTFNVMGCSDYGRVEVRVDKEGNPFVLEMNPNPSIGAKDCVPSVAQLDGLDYPAFLEEVLSLAIKRYKDKPPFYHLQMNTL